MVRRHLLKCDPLPFRDLLAGDKTFEIRRYDRDYHVGDLLTLRETTLPCNEVPDYEEMQLTGRSVKCKVTHIAWPGSGVPGLGDGYCILSIAPEDEDVLDEPNSALSTQVGGGHYKKLGDYQPWKVLQKWLTKEELKGAMKKEVIAYLAREADKGGHEDIEKAAHTLQLYLELIKLYDERPEDE